MSARLYDTLNPTEAPQASPALSPQTGPDVPAILRAALPWLTAVAALAILAHGFDLLAVCDAYSRSAIPAHRPDRWLWLIVPAAGIAGLAVAALPYGADGAAARPGSRVGPRITVALAALLSAAVFAVLPPACLLLTLALPAVSAYASTQAARRREAHGAPPAPFSLLPALLLVAVVSLAAAVRYDATAFRGLLHNDLPTSLVLGLPLPLDPDVANFLEIARDSTGYRTAQREPLYIWLLQAAHLVAGGGGWVPALARLTGIATSLLGVGLLFGFARALVGLPGATLAAALYAWAPFLAACAVRGLREDAIVSAALLLLWVAHRQWTRPAGWAGHAALGGAASALALLRLNSLQWIAVVLAVVAARQLWLRRRPVSQALPLAAPALMVAALSAPILIHHGQRYGDPFYASNIAVRFYANQEFAGVRPDMPTVAEVAADSTAGPPLKMGEYLFRYHTPLRLARGAAAGARRLYFGDFATQAYWVGPRPPMPAALWILHFGGLAAMLLPGRRLVFCAIALFHAPAFYLASFYWFDPRLLNLQYVGFHLGAGALLATALASPTYFRRSARPPPNP